MLAQGLAGVTDFSITERVDLSRFTLHPFPDSVDSGWYKPRNKSRCHYTLVGPIDSAEIFQHSDCSRSRSSDKRAGDDFALRDRVKTECDLFFDLHSFKL